jgi:hypothetical protein
VRCTRTHIHSLDPTRRWVMCELLFCCLCHDTILFTNKLRSEWIQELICYHSVYSPLSSSWLPTDIKIKIYSSFGKSLCTYKTCWKWCPRASIQAWTRLILFANTFCRSAFEMLLGIFQQIYTALNRCIYCLLETRIQQEKHVPQLKEQ